MSLKLKGLCFLGMGTITALGSCGAPPASNIKLLFPPLQPPPSNTEPFLGCPTDHAEPTHIVIPQEGSEVRTFPYKSSEQVNYFSPDWPNEVAATWDFFTEEMLGESAEQFRIVVIDTKTVSGTPHYHYYGNTTPTTNTAQTPVQGWSSTKVFGVAFAFHRLRLESNSQLGADSVIEGGFRIEDDMDQLNLVSSNMLGGFYKALAGRQLATDMITHWLQRPGESFGGFYGDNTWAHDARFDFQSESSGHSQEFQLRNEGASPNLLSPLTLAEAIKRLGVGFRDSILLPRFVDYSSAPDEETQRNADGPTLQQEDLRTLFYGNMSDGIGGMMYDGLRDIPHNLGGSSHLEKLTGGTWRTLAKGGSGYSSWRDKSEEAIAAYVCVPDVDGGVELAFFTHIEGPDKLPRLHRALARAVRALYPVLQEDP